LTDRLSRPGALAARSTRGAPAGPYPVLVFTAPGRTAVAGTARAVARATRHTLIGRADRIGRRTVGTIPRAATAVRRPSAAAAGCTARGATDSLGEHRPARAGRAALRLPRSAHHAHERRAAGLGAFAGVPLRPTFRGRGQLPVLPVV